MSDTVYDYLTRQTRLVEEGARNEANYLKQWTGCFKKDVPSDMVGALIGDVGVALLVAAVIVRLERNHGHGDLLPLVSDFTARLRAETA